MRVLAAVFALAFAAVLPAFSQERDVSKEAQALLTELDQLKLDSKSAEMEYVSIEKEHKRLQETADLLKGAKERLHQDFERHRDESPRHQAAVAELEPRCPGGTSSTDIPYVNACNAEIAKLNAWFHRLESEERLLTERANGLKERVVDLSNATVAFAHKAKANTARLADLQTRMANINSRFRRLMLSPNLDDLVKRERLSRTCKEEAAAGNLETAHRCLRQVWDGAR